MNKQDKQEKRTSEDVRVSIANEISTEIFKAFMEKVKNVPESEFEKWESPFKYRYMIGNLFGARYNDLNSLQLALWGLINGYKDLRFFTLWQAGKEGFNLKEGAKPCVVLGVYNTDKKTRKALSKHERHNDFFRKRLKEFEIKRINDTLEDDEKWFNRFVEKLGEPDQDNFIYFDAFKNHYLLYNTWVSYKKNYMYCVEEIENQEVLDKPKFKKHILSEKKAKPGDNIVIKALENVIKAFEKYTIRQASPRAYVVPEEKKIYLPFPSEFVSKNKEYDTSMHEYGHFVGIENKNRMAFLDKKGKEEQIGRGVEEAIAQITAEVILSEFNINSEKNSLVYIASWLDMVNIEEGGKLFNFIFSEVNRNIKAINKEVKNYFKNIAKNNEIENVQEEMSI